MNLFTTPELKTALREYENIVHNNKQFTENEQ